MTVTEDNFNCYYDFIRSFISEKTSMQALKTEEIIELCKIASNLLIASNINLLTDEVMDISKNIDYKVNS